MNKYQELKSELEKNGLTLLTDESDFKTTSDKVIISDGNYKAYVIAYDYFNLTKNKTPKWFYIRNPFIIDNINKLYEIKHNGDFICVSDFDIIKDRNTILEFKCTRCGKIIKKSIFNAIRTDEAHDGVKCPNCDGYLESIHAIVLKQMFKHYYPDSIEEDPSCINPKTNAVMPTDIVNHRLKIAIEVQGQWHRFESQKERDRIKKEYWLSRGYTFYDYSIDRISVLDYIRYFFPDINKLPDWIDMNYSKKLNLIKIQELLDSGLKVNDVAKQVGVNVYRIYDALHDNKLTYPEEYIKSTRHPVVMLDRKKNKIREYGSYADAEKDLGIKKCLIASCIYHKRYFSSGYYWIPKDIYESGDYEIPENKTDKFYFPVNKYDINDNFICRYEDMYEAAKDINTPVTKINAVVTGKSNSINGYKFKIA